MKKHIVLLILLGGILLWGCKDTWKDRFSGDPGSEMTVWEIISTKDDYQLFDSLLEKSGLDSVLMRNTVFTVFIPTASSLQQLISLSEDELIEELKFHISNSVVYSSDIEGMTMIKTLTGKQLFLEKKNGTILVNQNTPITYADIKAANGVIFEIESVQDVRPNLMDILKQDSDYGYIADYILSGTEVFFDEQNSIPVGIDTLGRTIYDSVWISNNEFFSDYADLSSEDKAFIVFFADNTILDTTQNGDYKEGYLTVLPRFIVRGLYQEDEISEDITTVVGTKLSLGPEKYNLDRKASNGFIYKLTELTDISVPVSVYWDFTAVHDFDSVRGIKSMDYLPYYESLTGMRVVNLEGGFSEFKYELQGGTLNGDYLKISTLGGTSVSLEFDLSDILTSKYMVSINATMRAADGITYDGYINDEMISEDNNFNQGLYSFATREIGEYTFTKSSGNVFRMDIKGDNAVHTKCFIDYLLFEPIN